MSLNQSEEIIDTLSYLLDFAGWISVDENTHDNCVQLKIDKLKQVIFSGGWVDIKERLPNKDGKYLVHYQTQVLCDSRYLPKFDVVNYSSCIRHFDFYHDHITHWQPLPPLPKSK